MQCAVDAGCAWVGTGSWTAMFNLLHASFTPALTLLSQVPNLFLNFYLNPDLPSSLFKLFILTRCNCFVFCFFNASLYSCILQISDLSEPLSSSPHFFLQLLLAFVPNCPPQQSSTAGALSLPSHWHSITSLRRSRLEMSDNVHFCPDKYLTLCEGFYFANFSKIYC